MSYELFGKFIILRNAWHFFMIIVSCNCCLVFDVAGRFNSQVCRSLLNLKGEVKKKQGAYVDFFAIIFYFFCYIGFWSEFHASIQIQQKKLNKVPNIKLVVWFRGSSMLRFRFSKKIWVKSRTLSWWCRLVIVVV